MKTTIDEIMQKAQDPSDDEQIKMLEFLKTLTILKFWQRFQFDSIFYVSLWIFFSNSIFERFSSKNFSISFF
jgi:hypothetical protein